MTRRDGFSSDMSRFALDPDAAERLMSGAVDIAGAPPRYGAVARTLRALREAPNSCELVGEPDAVEQIAAAVVLERTARSIRPSRRRSPRVAVLSATAIVACALPLVGGLASAGALPEPAQNAAAAVLGKVGISVPISDPSNNGPAPAPAVPGPPSTAGPSPGRGRVRTRAPARRPQTRASVLLEARARRLPPTTRVTSAGTRWTAVLPPTTRTTAQASTTGRRTLEATGAKEAMRATTSGSGCNARASADRSSLWCPRTVDAGSTTLLKPSRPACGPRLGGSGVPRESVGASAREPLDLGACRAPMSAAEPSGVRLRP